MTTAPNPENPAVAGLKLRKAADHRVLMTRNDCMLEGGWKASTQDLKEKIGALHRVNVGLRVMITAESFWDHLIDLANDPPKRLRAPRTMFKKQPRPRTPQELRGLETGNAKRAEDARLRRARERA